MMVVCTGQNPADRDTGNLPRAGMGGNRAVSRHAGNEGDAEVIRSGRNEEESGDGGHAACATS
jgi:hypothetical protein